MGLTTIILLVFTAAVAFLLGTAAVRFDPAVAGEKQSLKIDFTKIRNWVSVALPLTLAFYLMIISIVTTQIFDEKGGGEPEPQRLDQSLADLGKEVPVSLQNVSTSVRDPNEVTILAGIAENYPDVNSYVNLVRAKLQYYNDRLVEQPKLFQGSASQERQAILQQFKIENRDRLGVRQTEAHADELIKFFARWVTAWAPAAKNCRDTISDAQARLDAFTRDINEAFKKGPQGEVNFPPWPDLFLESLQSRLAQECDINTTLSNQIIPSRDAIDPSLATFGTIGGPIAGWLVETDSRDIVLIVGLLGFGIFGALSATFIRPRRAAVDKHQIMNAFIRGIAAAIVVYLCVVGGLAVFARNSTPNPYAVFFGCLVAAVFSEDVWKWARRRQHESLDVTKRTSRPSGPK